MGATAMSVVLVEDGFEATGTYVATSKASQVSGVYLSEKLWSIEISQVNVRLYTAIGKIERAIPEANSPSAMRQASRLSLCTIAMAI
jgi:hypothetical protein